MLFNLVGADRVPTQVDIPKRRIQQARFYAAKVHNDYARKMFSPANRPAAHVTDDEVRQLQAREYAHARDIKRGLLDHTYYVWSRMNRYLTGVDVGYFPKNSLSITGGGVD